MTCLLINGSDRPGRRLADPGAVHRAAGGRAFDPAQPLSHRPYQLPAVLHRERLRQGDRAIDLLRLGGDHLRDPQVSVQQRHLAGLHPPAQPPAAGGALPRVRERAAAGDRRRQLHADRGRPPGPHPRLPHRAGRRVGAVVERHGPDDRASGRWPTATPNLKALCIETSFDNSLQEVADVSLHLTPRTLELELRKLHRRVPVLLHHLKPPCVARIYEEVGQLGNPDVELPGAGQGVPLLAATGGHQVGWRWPGVIPLSAVAPPSWPDSRLDLRRPCRISPGTAWRCRRGRAACSIRHHSSPRPRRPFSRFLSLRVSPRRPAGPKTCRRASLPSAGRRPGPRRPRQAPGRACRRCGWSCWARAAAATRWCVESGRHRILIDAGFSCRELARRLALVDVDPKPLGPGPHPRARRPLPGRRPLRAPLPLADLCHRRHARRRAALRRDRRRRATVLRSGEPCEVAGFQRRAVPDAARRPRADRRGASRTAPAAGWGWWPIAAPHSHLAWAPAARPGRPAAGDQPRPRHAAQRPVSVAAQAAGRRPPWPPVEPGGRRRAPRADRASACAGWCSTTCRAPTTCPPWPPPTIGEALDREGCGARLAVTEQFQPTPGWRRTEGIRVKARVTVYPRREILDPQGKAIRDALARVGFAGVDDVRAGKSFEIRLGHRGSARPPSGSCARCARSCSPTRWSRTTRWRSSAGSRP